MKYLFLLLSLLVIESSCNNKPTIIHSKNIPSSAEEHELERKRILLQEKFRFTDLYDFTEGLAVFKTDSSVGAIDTTGKIIFSIDSAISLSPFKFGYAVLTYGGENELKAFVNNAGKIVYKASDHGFTFIDNFNQFGYSLIINQQNQRGILDTNFSIILAPKYDDVFVIGNNRFQVLKNKQSGIVDSTHKILVDFVFDKMEYFTDDLKMICFKNDHWGIYDSMGKLIHLFDCDELIYSGDLIAMHKWNNNHVNQWALVDTSGNFVVPYAKYSDCSSFSNGLAMVYNEVHDAKDASKYSELIGFVNNTGREIIPLQYEDGFSFREGLAAVKKNNKWGYIDTSGKVVINFLFDQAGSFYKGYAEVKQNGKNKMIDQKGVELK